MSSKTWQIFLLMLCYMITCLPIRASSFDDGATAYEAGDQAKAEKHFQAAITMKETAAIRHNLALVAYRMGDKAEAAWQLERAIALDPLNQTYQVKRESLRQELGLFQSGQKWYHMLTSVLSANKWIIIAMLSFWCFLAFYLLPLILRIKVGIGIKAGRSICAFALLLAAPAIWIHLQLLQTGVIVSSDTAELHYAPAKAAPVSGTARPGERAKMIGQYNEFYEIKTESNGRGWIPKELFRPLKSL